MEPPHVITDVRFGSFTDEDIRRLSVLKVTNPTTVDQLGRPIRGGLYDPAMGPTEDFQICETCGMNQFSCPGHPGHIELCVPVYHPLFFARLYKLMKSICLHCHKFRIPEEELTPLLQEVAILRQNTLDLGGQGVKGYPLVGDDDHEKRKGKKDGVDSMKIEAHEKSYVTSDQRTERITQHVNARLQKVVRDIFSRISTKCACCGVVSTNIRREGYKLFRAKGGKASVLSERSVGTRVEDVMLAETRGDDSSEDGSDVAVQDEDDEMEEEIKKKIQTRKEKGKDAADGIELDLGQTKSRPPKTKKKVRTTESDEEEAVDGPSHADVATDGSSKGRDLVFMTPFEVKRHIEELFVVEKDACELIFGSECGPHMYFVESVVVPPNRFRPMMSVEDGTLREHPQNVYLTRILHSNLGMLEMSRGRETGIEKMKRGLPLWAALQDAVSKMMDNGDSATQGSDPIGIRQVLEKKEGLFRKHMMGKRVNFSARSVISPDPNIETSEIGVPLYFAQKLHYPEPVTVHNVKMLSQMVINGPSKYPGAMFVEDSRHHLVDLASRSQTQRIALSKSLLRSDGIPKKVYRHLLDGDVMIVNRQPTLHKPSMMCHRARVIHTDHKVIRMHYANCGSYNADFDGDEINLHFPQNELARSEGYVIANTDNQYIVPTSGGPIRGLIQDHVVSGVLLTKRDTLLTKEEYQGLVYAGLFGSVGQRKIRTVPPCIIRPKELWTGKQVVETILNNIVDEEYPGLNIRSRAKVHSALWGSEIAEEDDVLFFDGYYVHGVLDKSQFGASKFGLVHSVFECYGSETAGRLLTVLGRLFSAYLQMHGFTCGLEDMVLDPHADEERQVLLDQANHDASVATSDFEKRHRTTDRPTLRQIVADEKMDRQLDIDVKGVLSKCTSDVISMCIPSGMKKRFPHNCILLMTNAGAKGSKVNAAQISCLLGLQEFEGRRVGRMISGKTLPTFFQYDKSARAGGYIADRFLTGLRPPEYFFHCMAGRDGLVDTAVKTARSGYLQRCLVKHLEGLRVEYDGTVRNIDGSIVQFTYGEDGLDCTRTSYLHDFDFVWENRKMFDIIAGEVPKTVKTKEKKKLMKKKSREVIKHGLCSRENPIDPLISRYSPYAYFGSVSEDYHQRMVSHFKKHRERKDRLFKKLLKMRYMHALADPGEAVGLLAAQSVGEPSTQMTLNTFHFAGVDAAHVTVGIPRLRELLMTGSFKSNIMRIPLRKDVSKDEAERMQAILSRIPLGEAVEKVMLDESLLVEKSSGLRGRKITVQCQLFNEDVVKKHIHMNYDDLAPALEQQFVARLCAVVEKELKRGRKKRRLDGDEDLSKLIDEDFETIDESSMPVEKDVEKPIEEDGADVDKSRGNKREAVSYDDRDEDEEDIVLGDDEEEDGKREKKRKAVKKPVVRKSLKASSSVNLCFTEQSRMALQHKYSCLGHYVFDRKKGIVTVILRMNADSQRILFSSVIQRVLSQCYASFVDGIESCRLIKDDGRYVLTIEGSDLDPIFALGDPMVLPEIRCTNVRLILHRFGVEAAREALKKELKSVFDLYGIAVDVRHLGLIADYMTFEGGYTAFNRIGIQSNTSPFTKMSFETTTKFLTDACAAGDVDYVRSPSSRIVCGRPTPVGTGSFELVHLLTD